MINAVIADDEVLARHNLRQLLREENRDSRSSARAATAAETIDLVRLTKLLTMLFLDIRMPDMDGFDIIGALSADADSRSCRASSSLRHTTVTPSAPSKSTRLTIC